jgi:hypothetical protein
VWFPLKNTFSFRDSFFDAFAWRDSTHKNVPNQVKNCKKFSSKKVFFWFSAKKGGYTFVERLRNSRPPFLKNSSPCPQKPASFSRPSSDTT